MHDELAELRERISRIEAREACISTFNEYLYFMDGEYLDDLIGVFAEDAELQIMNYPIGSGENSEYKGRKDIRPIYAAFHDSHSDRKTRHHSANITINVHPDCKTADLSAYFITATAYDLNGGMYEGTLKLIEGKWLITHLRISVTWGWLVPHEDQPFLDNDFGEGTLRKGRPVPYEQYNPKN